MKFLSFIFVIAMTTGCLQREDAPAENLGPEVPGEKVDIAIKSLLYPDPYTIQKGEFVARSDIMEIGGIAKSRVSDTGLTVINRQEDEKKIDFTVLKNELTYQNNKTMKATTEIFLSLSKEVEPTSRTNLSIVKGTEPIFKISEVLKPFDVQRKITYHNLETFSTIEDPPKFVQERSNCGGVLNCKIRVQTIRFNQVEWSAKGHDRYIREFRVSPDVPYLAAALSNCITGIVPYGEIKTLLRQCERVEDFTFGKP